MLLRPLVTTTTTTRRLATTAERDAHWRPSSPPPTCATFHSTTPTRRQLDRQPISSLALTSFRLSLIITLCDGTFCNAVTYFVLLPPPRRSCFCLGLSVCQRHYSRRSGWICMTSLAETEPLDNNRLQCYSNPDPDPGIFTSPGNSRRDVVSWCLSPLQRYVKPFTVIVIKLSE